MKRTTSTWEHNGYTLRPARKEDAENYYRAGFERLDPELARLTGSKERYSRDEVISFFLACLDDPDRRDFLLVDPAGRIAGECVINEIDWDARCANFRIGIFRPEDRDRAWAPGAVRVTRDLAFRGAGPPPAGPGRVLLQPPCPPGLSGRGLSGRGVCRDAVRDGDGYGDDILMAILEDEWRAVKTREAHLDS